MNKNEKIIKVFICISIWCNVWSGMLNFLLGSVKRETWAVVSSVIIGLKYVQPIFHLSAYIHAYIHTTYINILKSISEKGQPLTFFLMHKFKLLNNREWNLYKHWFYWSAFLKNKGGLVISIKPQQKDHS